MSKFNLREKGKHYEEMVIDFFEKKGYTVVAKNYYFGHKELDIVAVKDNVIVFAEVKFRKQQKNFNPLEAISQKKIANMRDCGIDFIEKNREYGNHYGRLDGVFIIDDKGKEEIVHIENIGV